MSALKLLACHTCRASERIMPREGTRTCSSSKPGFPSLLIGFSWFANGQLTPPRLMHTIVAMLKSDTIQANKAIQRDLVGCNRTPCAERLVPLRVMFSYRRSSRNGGAGEFERMRMSRVRVSRRRRLGAWGKGKRTRKILGKLGIVRAARAEKECVGSEGWSRSSSATIVAALLWSLASSGVVECGGRRRGVGAFERVL